MSTNPAPPAEILVFYKFHHIIILISLTLHVKNLPIVPGEQLEVHAFILENQTLTGSPVALLQCSGQNLSTQLVISGERFPHKRTLKHIDGFIIFSITQNRPQHWIASAVPLPDFYSFSDCSLSTEEILSSEPENPSISEEAVITEDTVSETVSEATLSDASIDDASIDDTSTLNAPTEDALTEDVSADDTSIHDASIQAKKITHAKFPHFHADSGHLPTIVFFCMAVIIIITFS